MKNIIALSFLIMLCTPVFVFSDCLYSGNENNNIAFSLISLGDKDIPLTGFNLSFGLSNSLDVFFSYAKSLWDIGVEYPRPAYSQYEFGIEYYIIKPTPENPLVLSLGATYMSGDHTNESDTPYTFNGYSVGPTIGFDLLPNNYLNLIPYLGIRYVGSYIDNKDTNSSKTDGALVEILGLSASTPPSGNVYFISPTLSINKNETNFNVALGMQFNFDADPILASLNRP